MLKKFAAALVATTLIAGAGFRRSNHPARRRYARDAGRSAAANPASVTPTTTAATKTAPSKTASTKTSSTKSVKHARKHVARGKTGRIHQAHHVKPAKTHQAGVAKSTKPIDGGRSRA